MNKICGIYSITSPSGRVYIGSSIEIEQRWRHHRNALKRGTHTNRLLQNVFNKHGELTFAIVELCDAADLPTREQFHIDAQARSLNLAADVSAHMRGRKVPAETRAKMRAAALARGISAETRAKMQGPRKVTEAMLAHVEALAHAARGKVRGAMTDAQRAKISKAKAAGSSGYKGVSRHGKNWRARVTMRNARQDIGTYKTVDLAYAVRLVWLASGAA